MQNKFRPYNKSLLANVFMSSEYKDAYKNYLIPLNYYSINLRNDIGEFPLLSTYTYNKINIARLLLNHPYIDTYIKSEDIQLILLNIQNYNSICILIKSLGFNHINKNKIKIGNLIKAKIYDK